MQRAQQPRKQTDHVDIEAELWRAIQAGRRVDLVEAVGISPTLITVVGAAFVEFFGHYYQPDPGGVPALISGVVEHGDLVDLAALELEGPRVASRLGWATALHHDLIEDARWRERGLDIVGPLQWVREPDGACCIVDWSSAAFELRGVEPLVCESDIIAQCVRHEFIRHHLPLPSILVPA